MINYGPQTFDAARNRARSGCSVQHHPVIGCHGNLVFMRKPHSHALDDAVRTLPVPAIYHHDVLVLTMRNILRTPLAIKDQNNHVLGTVLKVGQLPVQLYPGHAGIMLMQLAQMRGRENGAVPIHYDNLLHK